MDVVSGSFGSLTPTVDRNGHTIGELISSVIARGTEYQIKLSVQATVTQSYFSALVNHTLGITLASCRGPLMSANELLVKG